MRQAATGDRVSVHYTGSLADGQVFDSSIEREPVEVTLGERQVVPGFEDAIIGMAEGDTKTVTVEPEEAFGPHDPQLVHNVERERIPPEVDLDIGTQLQATDPSGNRVNLVVTEVNDDKVTLDANHPLAGKALTFELKLVEFVE